MTAIFLFRIIIIIIFIEINSTDNFDLIWQIWHINQGAIIIIIGPYYYYLITISLNTSTITLSDDCLTIG